MIHNYDSYNREERALCSHLFRLLHEGLTTNPKKCPLAQLLFELAVRDNERLAPLGELPGEMIAQAAIHAEVALIRDAFFARPDKDAQIAALLQEVEVFTGIRDYRRAGDIDPRLAGLHPVHIRQVARQNGISLTDNEHTVYSELQALFRAKPDLAIVVDRYLVVFEAKFTEKFTASQLRRTEWIAKLWAKLYAADLGLPPDAIVWVGKLGAARDKPHLSWEWLTGLAASTYPENDRSRKAFLHAAQLLHPGEPYQVCVVAGAFDSLGCEPG